MNRRSCHTSVILPHLVGFVLCLGFSRVLKAATLPQEVYVWQRAWTEPVRRAVVEHGEVFSKIVVLKAEVTWQASKPVLVQIPVDYASLAVSRRPIGLALRIGPYSGAFNHTNASSIYLADLSQRILRDAQGAGIKISELQLDFDCASSKLDGYRAWAEVIRAQVSPVPMVITALPSWLDEPGFKPLVQATDGYVLQVHSLERPKSFDANFDLCDQANARRAVEKARQIGLPFRVALPTYGYLIAFDRKGAFIGLSAEGPAKSWPADARLKEVRADPMEIAHLVQDWSANPPPSLKALVWYRLPVRGDTLNWRWPTFGAILQSRIPRKSVRAEAHRVEPGLVEIGLANDGELDISSRLAVKARWSGTRLVAGDGLHGFQTTDRDFSTVTFETGLRPYRLSAGERQVIGWLRLDKDREVLVEIDELDGQ